MLCSTCNSILRKYGRNSNGVQRFRCPFCLKISLAPQEKLFGEMKIPTKKGLSCLYSLIEGMSIRSTERITGVHRDTILNLLFSVGEKCERLLKERISEIPVKEVQADEIWGFVFCKDKTKKRNKINSDSVGSAWTYVAIERYSRLVLAWHLGKRSQEDTEAFAEKINKATSSRFQLSTDGFNAYPDAISLSLGTRVDFAQLNKTFKPAYKSQSSEDRRYSPPPLLKLQKIKRIGKPILKYVSTSHVERHNLTMRMSIRRLTRLTNAFSKKWENLRAALAFYFAYYNFCRVHSSLRCTPAMAAGVTNHIWTLRELLS